MIALMCLGALYGIHFETIKVHDTAELLSSPFGPIYTIAASSKNRERKVARIDIGGRVVQIGKLADDRVAVGVDGRGLLVSKSVNDLAYVTKTAKVSPKILGHTLAGVFGRYVICLSVPASLQITEVSGYCRSLSTPIQDIRAISVAPSNQFIVMLLRRQGRYQIAKFSPHSEASGISYLGLHPDKLDLEDILLTVSNSTSIGFIREAVTRDGLPLVKLSGIGARSTRTLVLISHQTGLIKRLVRIELDPNVLERSHFRRLACYGIGPSAVAILQTSSRIVMIML